MDSSIKNHHPFAHDIKKVETKKEHSIFFISFYVYLYKEHKFIFLITISYVKCSYVATFQQHPHMEYIYLSWYDIPELVVSIRISLIRGLLLTRRLLNQGFLLAKLKSLLRTFYDRHHDLVDPLKIGVGDGVNSGDRKGRQFLLC